jgi:hypothetical protein
MQQLRLRNQGVDHADRGVDERDRGVAVGELCPGRG